MTFQIFVKTLRGKTITLDVSSADTIHNIKQKIYDNDNFPVEHQILTYNGKKLLPHHNIAHYGIDRDCTLHLSVKLLSGNIMLKICQVKTSLPYKIEIPITSLTTLAEFKQRCIANPRLVNTSIKIGKSVKIVHDDHILANDNIRMMDIENWSGSLFHTRSSATLPEVKHIRFVLFKNKSHDKYVSDIQPLYDQKALISTLIYEYLKSTDVNPLFYCGYPHCPFKFVRITLNGMTYNLPLRLRMSNWTKKQLFTPFNGQVSGHGTIPTIPLDSCCEFSKCDCHFSQSIDDWENIIEIEVGLPDICFLFRNYYYMNGKFYKIFQPDPNTFHLHFCTTFLPKPLKLNEQLLVYGYIRNTFCKYYNKTSEDIINLIAVFYPQLLGCGYEVSKYDKGLSDKLDQKTNIFEIGALECYLKYVENYEQFSQTRKGLHLVLACKDKSISTITLLCRLHCKITKQKYTCILQTNLSNNNKTKNIILTDFGPLSSLEAIVCNITVLNMLKSNLKELYEYPMIITQNDYFMEWKIDEQIVELVKKSVVGESRWHPFESTIFYDMFVIRCVCKKDKLYIGIHLIALPMNKRDENGLLIEGQIYVSYGDIYSQKVRFSEEFINAFNYTGDNAATYYNFSSIIKSIEKKNMNVLTIRAKFEILESEK